MRVVLTCLLAAILVAGNTTNVAGRDDPPETQLRVISASPQSLVVALTVARPTEETVQLDGESYRRIVISDTAETVTPGAPQAPTRGALVGLPTISGASVRVLQAECEVRSGFRLPPAPQPALAEDGAMGIASGRIEARPAALSAIYDADSFYPPALAELGEVGYIRDQAVAQVQFYPVQHNPARGQTRICSRIVAEVTWDATALPLTSERTIPSAAFEDMFRSTLLNYEFLDRTSTASPAVSQPIPAANDSRSESTALLKIGIGESGIYRITYADLASAGFGPDSIDPRTLKITNRGVEVAIYVYGEADGVFNGGDYLLFYGRELRDAYTHVNVYWLSGGGGPGRRMAQRDGSPRPGTPSPSYFPVVHHAEEDTAYWQTMPSLSGEDRWFWGTRISPNTSGMPSGRDYTVRLGKISTVATNAVVRVRLKGYTDLAHRTQLRLNGQVIDERSWQGQVQYTHEVALPSAFLRDGDNVVRVTTLNSGASVDQLLVNWMEIEYAAGYNAEDNHLAFRTPDPGQQRLVVDGFGAPAIAVFDVTDVAAPARILNMLIEGASASFKVTFEEYVQVEGRYEALTADRFLRPLSLLLDEPSTWKSPANGADYIIITHEDFYDSALPLALHRHAGGLRVARVKIQDVYDEFNDGIFNPGAIRSFLQYAFASWQSPSPAFVLLLGDASQDYHDNLHTGTPNYVPSKNIESTLFGEVSSDQWFVTVSGADSLPDLFIGRFPAQTPAEADVMVAKAIVHDQRLFNAAWSRQALFVADDDEPQFVELAEQLAGRLPWGYDISRVYAAAYPPGDPTQDIIARINAGSALVTYIGHGEYYAWGRWNDNRDFIFHASNVQELSNAGKLPIDKLPIVIVGNCLNGFFAGPKDNASLAEILLRREDAGAVAMWAPTGLGYPSGHRILLDEFYKAVFVNNQRTLGAATTAAKIATLGQSSFWGELVATYVLFGDPATRLETPYEYKHKAYLPYVPR